MVGKLQQWFTSDLIGRWLIGIAVGLMLVSCFTPPVQARQDFRQFLESFWPQAKRAGVSRSMFLRAIGGITPDPSIMKAQSSQPEFVSPVWTYIERAVSEKRLEAGKAAWLSMNSCSIR